MPTITLWKDQQTEIYTQYLKEEMGYDIEITDTKYKVTGHPRLILSILKWPGLISDFFSILWDRTGYLTDYSLDQIVLSDTNTNEKQKILLSIEREVKLEAIALSVFLGYPSLTAYILKAIEEKTQREKERILSLAKNI